MMLDVRKTLVWATLAAAVLSALWLGATDGSVPRLGAAAPGEGDASARPALIIERHAPSAGPTSRAH